MEIRFRWLQEASGSVSPFERLVKLCFCGVSVAEFASQRQVRFEIKKQVFISSEKRDRISDEI